MLAVIFIAVSVLAIVLLITVELDIVSITPCACMSCKYGHWSKKHHLKIVCDKHYIIMKPYGFCSDGKRDY